MKALLLYSHTSGHRDFSKEIKLIRRELDSFFSPFDVVCTMSADEAGRLEEGACDGHYDVLIIVGGDGTFNNAVNHLMKHETRPILGYMNFGTMGDVGKNFGIRRSLKKAIRIIKNGHVSSFDVGEIGGSYFAYTCSIGRYSDIAYKTSRKKKRIAGKNAYYVEATKQALKAKEFSYSIKANGHVYQGRAPFFMVLNGKYMGGFLVNEKADLNDGKMELFLTKPGFFNGLLHYLFNFNLKVISSDSFEVMESDSMPWCLDGEMGPKGNFKIVTHHSALKIFSK